jgi:hypothetical protein
MLSTIQRESPDLIAHEKARSRYVDTRERLEGVVKASGGEFTTGRVIEGFKALGDEVSEAVAERIEQGAYRLVLARGETFESLVAERGRQEGCEDGSIPCTSNSVYVTSGRGGGPTLYSRTRPLNLPWNLSRTDIFFQLLANIVHDDCHHRDLISRPFGRPTARQRFHWELRAHGEEFLWRARHGDVGWLARFVGPSPRSFVESFRKYYEGFY